MLAGTQTLIYGDDACESEVEQKNWEIETL